MTLLPRSLPARLTLLGALSFGFACAAHAQPISALPPGALPPGTNLGDAEFSPLDDTLALLDKTAAQISFVKVAAE